MKEISKEWIRKAENDFKVAFREIMRDDEPVYDAICFHSQQCIEKYLKAVLQENDVYIERTHDLWKIAKNCIPYLNYLQELKEKLISVSAYAVEIRYPGESATEEEAKESFDICKEVRKLVRKYFGLEVEE